MEKDVEQKFKDLEMRIEKLEKQVQLLTKKTDPKQISRDLGRLAAMSGL